MSTLVVRLTSRRPRRLAWRRFVATPPDVVERMLTTRRHRTSKDVVYDLGCGDGRIVIAAAQNFGARGVGVDIDASSDRDQHEAAARDAGVERLVTFKVQDAMTVDVSEATIVTLYLLAASNVKLRPIADPACCGQAPASSRTTFRWAGLGAGGRRQLYGCDGTTQDALSSGRRTAIDFS